MLVHHVLFCSEYNSLHLDQIDSDIIVLEHSLFFGNGIPPEI